MHGISIRFFKKLIIVIFKIWQFYLFYIWLVYEYFEIYAIAAGEAARYGSDSTKMILPVPVLLKKTIGEEY
jgi:hypothetical protein